MARSTEQLERRVAELEAEQRVRSAAAKEGLDADMVVAHLAQRDELRFIESDHEAGVFTRRVGADRPHLRVGGAGGSAPGAIPAPARRDGAGQPFFSHEQLVAFDKPTIDAIKAQDAATYWRSVDYLGSAAGGGSASAYLGSRR